MSYQIKITYDTGDSFHNEYDVVSYCGLTWEDKKTAQQNLKRIKDHYSFLNQKEKKHRDHKINNRKLKEWLSEFEKEDWFDKRFNEVCLFLYDDEGKQFQQSAFWAGFFERLTSAEIVLNNGWESEDIFIP